MSGRFTYGMFDQALVSSVRLPELEPIAAAGAASLSFRMGDPGALRSQRWRHVHDWLLGDGSVVLSCYRAGDSYRLEFPGLADFLIDAGSRALTGIPAAGTTPATIRHLLLDQVVPRVVGHGGRLVVHGAAVRFGKGLGVALLGPTGAGKSTLAAALGRRGAEIMTDDCVLLEPAGPGIRGLAAYRGLRLWPDAIDATMARGQPVERMAYYSDKRRVSLRNAACSRGLEPFALSGILLLSRAGDPGDPVRIASAGGAEALMAFLSCLFTLDVPDPENAATVFRRAGAMLASGLPIHHLSYPSDFGCLDAVCAAVREWLGDLPPRRAGLDGRRRVRDQDSVPTAGARPETPFP